MRPRYSFDLENAIATWRQFVSKERSITDDDLDELEDHLRFEIEALSGSGLSDEERFRRGLDEIGDLAATSDSYRAVELEKRLTLSRLPEEIRAAAAMIHSTVRSTIRGFSRHASYFFLNLAGLSVAMAVVLVIGVFAFHSLRFDRHLDGHDRIYRVEQISGDATHYAAAPRGLANTLRSLTTGIEHATEVYGFGRTERLFTVGTDHFQVDGVLPADSAFFSVFPFPLVEGDASTALMNPNSIVLTESLSRRLFGTTESIGRTVRLYGRDDYQVTGIATDPPPETTLRFSAVHSTTVPEIEPNWNSMSGRTWVRLDASTSPDEYTTQVESLARRAQPDWWERGSRIFLQQLSRHHLFGKSIGGFASPSDVRYIYLFGGIGLLVLMMACINYMNLTMARSLRRTREVGVRMAVGARRSQLARQFVGETSILVLLAVVPSILLAKAALPWINTVTGLELALSSAINPAFLLALIALLAITSIGGGGYPALLLSRLNPSNVFRSSGAGLGQHGRLRRYLICFQVVATFCLVSGTLIFQNQMEFIQSARLGFDKEQILSSKGHLSGWTAEQFATFKNRTLRSDSIEHLSLGFPLGRGDQMITGQKIDPVTSDTLRFAAMEVGAAYAETMGLHLLSGKTLLSGTEAQIGQIALITESFARRLFPDGSPIGQSFTLLDTDVEVQGVVADVQNAPFRISQFTSSASDMSVFLLQRVRPQSLTGMIARIAPGRTSEAVSALTTAWDAVSPDRPFEFAFLDEQIESLYSAEYRLMHLFKIFAGLSILIACLGLFGLASLTSEQRTREIGIRKSLGASVRSILLLLSRDYFLIAGAGVLISIPITYSLGTRWLQNFSAGISVGFDLMVGTSLIIVGFVLISVLFQSLRAARTNPADAVRHD